jgi:signal transduction histidine kinase
VTNAGLGVVLAAVLAADTAVTATENGGWLFELTVGAIVCTLALFRDRDRTRIAAAGLVVCAAAAFTADVAHLPSQPGVTATLALLVLGAAVARVAAARPAAVVASAGVVVLVAGRVELRPAYAAAWMFLGVLAWAGALSVGLWLRFLDGRRRAAIDTARRDERLELARELHDLVAHHVTAVVLQSQAARLAAAKHPETLDGTLAAIESASTDALAAMRRVLGLLRDTHDAAGLTPGPGRLTDLVDRFARNGPSVELQMPPGPTEPEWPPEVTSTIYRIVQEALTNVLRHAPGASIVTVTVDDHPAGVTVTVTDDAPTTNPSRLTNGGGYGLIGMRERVQALDGTLDAGPRTGGGWSVHATIPLPTRSA